MKLGSCMMPLNKKISIIRKAVKQECNSLVVGYDNVLGRKYLAIKPPISANRGGSFSPHEKQTIVRLFGDIIGISNPMNVPMGVVYIDNIDAFVGRSLNIINK